MNQKLLIVDDNVEILESFSELLTDEGYTIRSVSSAEEALEVLDHFQPAVILTDMNMPGMSGLELMKRVRESDGEVQFVVITGYATISNVAESMTDNGAFAYLQKPVMDFEFLFTTLRQAFQKYELIRENAQWQERLRTANAAFESIFENMDAAIYVADIETYELIYANTKLKKLAGIEAEESYKGKMCWNVLQSEKNGPCSFCCNDKLVDESGTPLPPYTYEFYHPEFEKYFSVKDQAIQWHDGRVVRLEVAMDMTRYKRLAREMQKAKRFKAIGVLAGGIAHDLNNTLAAIMGNLNLAQMMKEGQDADECFEAAEEGIMQAKALAEKLLEISRGEDPVRETVDMQKVIEKFITEGEPKAICRFAPPEADTENDAGTVDLDFRVRADVDQIHTVLYNLVTNAWEAMEGSSLVQLTLKRHFSRERNCDYVVVQIKDTGQGIPPENMDKVFDPYFTTKFPGSEKGTGLGLSIAYSIVKRHGGFIDIDSIVGKGTQVNVFIPFIGNDCVSEGGKV